MRLLGIVGRTEFFIKRMQERTLVVVAVVPGDLAHTHVGDWPGIGHEEG